MRTIPWENSKSLIQNIAPHVKTSLYIYLVVCCNESTSKEVHDAFEDKAREVYDTLPLGIRGHVCMQADHFYISQKIDRPMCGGIFLDWKPS